MRTRRPCALADSRSGGECVPVLLPGNAIALFTPMLLQQSPGAPVTVQFLIRAAGWGLESARRTSVPGMRLLRVPAPGFPQQGSAHHFFICSEEHLGGITCIP